MQVEQRYYSDVQEVQEALSVERTNKLLGSGWELLKIVECSTIDASTKTSRIEIKYVLGRRAVKP